MRQNRFVVYLEEHGPSTPTDVARALDVIGGPTQAATAMRRLVHENRLCIVGQRTMPTGQLANVFDVCDDIPRHDTQDIVAAALANQPELARVWGNQARATH